MTSSRPPPWTPTEDARLIHLRESGETGQALYTAIPNRSADAVQKHLQALRRQRVVR